MIEVQRERRVLNSIPKRLFCEVCMTGKLGIQRIELHCYATGLNVTLYLGAHWQHDETDNNETEWKQLNRQT